MPISSSVLNGIHSDNIFVPGSGSRPPESMTQRLNAVQSSLAALDAKPTGSPGDIIYTAKNTAPTGYLKANGALVSRTTYSALFTAIGTTFGVGDGSTTFALPDLRGEFIRGWDDSRGVDSGRAFGSSQADDNKAHTHTITVNTDAQVGTVAAAGWNQGTYAYPSTNSSGGTEARPKNVALLACIKY